MTVKFFSSTDMNIETSSMYVFGAAQSEAHKQMWSISNNQLLAQHFMCYTKRIGQWMRINKLSNAAELLVSVCSRMNNAQWTMSDERQLWRIAQQEAPANIRQKKLTTSSKLQLAFFIEKQQLGTNQVFKSQLSNGAQR